MKKEGFGTDERDRMLKDMMQTMMEVMMDRERTEFLGYEHGERSERVKKNVRNGTRSRSLQTGLGWMEDLKVPRDRIGEFAPVLLREFERRTANTDHLILSLYSKGMSTRDIGEILKTVYGKEASPQTISNLTQTIESEREAWHKRELKKRYVALFVDALMVKMRRETVASDAVYLVLGIDEEGHRDILSMEVGAAESASEWKTIFHGLRERGVEDVLIIIMDGLTGLPDGARSVFPKADIQGCVVHQMRSTLNRIRPKHKQEVADDLKRVYQSETVDLARTALDDVLEKWQRDYPRAFQRWDEHLDHFMTFLKYPRLFQKMIYTTNWIERTNKELRKVCKTKNSFPTETAVLNLLYLRIMDITAKWEDRKVRDFEEFKFDLEKMWDERYPARTHSS